MVDDLQTQLSSREQQLGVLENLILTRELNKQVYPEGRPVQDGLDLIVFRRARGSFHRLLGGAQGRRLRGSRGHQGVGGGGGAGDLRRRAAPATARWSRSTMATAWPPAIATTKSCW